MKILEMVSMISIIFSFKKDVRKSVRPLFSSAVVGDEPEDLYDLRFKNVLKLYSTVSRPVELIKHRLRGSHVCIIGLGKLVFGQIIVLVLTS